MTKRTLTALLGGILLLTGVSSALALDTKHKAGLEERVREGPRYHPFRRPLRDKFVPWDRGYWRDLKLDFDKETRHLYRQLLGKERELRELLRESCPDSTKIHMLIDEIVSIWAEIQKEVVDTHLGLKEKFDMRGWVSFPPAFGCGFWMKRRSFPPLYGYWWYWGEDCPFSPFE